MTKSLQFTRKQIGGGSDPNENEAVETLSLVQSGEGDGRAFYVQVEAGTPDDLGDYVRLYTLDGEQVQHTVGEFELVPGDRIAAGDAANACADVLAEEAAHAAGGGFTRADYLAADGSLPFASIFADWGALDLVTTEARGSTR
jgi:hypothetical protein